MTDVNDVPGQFRRLPPRVPPTSTAYDVSPPASAPEVKYVHSLSPAGNLQAYEQIADFATSTTRGRRLRTVVLVLLGLVFLAVVLSRVL